MIDQRFQVLEFKERLKSDEEPEITSCAGQ